MKKNKKKHASVSATDGINYRDMAATMTKLGYPMFHSSARNYVIRIMYTFAKKLNDRLELNLTESQLWARARSPEFQEIIGQILNKNADERQT